MWQGEDRDSSDDEWEASYAAMDRIGRYGWGNRPPEMAEVGTQLVRDVFVAADELHENAMSEMDGNSPMEEDTWGGEAVAGEASTSQRREAGMEQRSGMQAGGEGVQLWVSLPLQHSLVCNCTRVLLTSCSIFGWSVHPLILTVAFQKRLAYGLICMC